MTARLTSYYGEVLGRQRKMEESSSNWQLKLNFMIQEVQKANNIVLKLLFVTTIYTAPNYHIKTKATQSSKMFLNKIFFYHWLDTQSHLCMHGQGLWFTKKF